MQTTPCGASKDHHGGGMFAMLPELGMENYVVRPRNCDEYGSLVKTGARDVRELCKHLDRHFAGNEGALYVVRVPTEGQEQTWISSLQ